MAGGGRPGVRNIGQVAINATDIDRAIAFYRDTVGLAFLFQTGNLAFFDCGGVRLMLDVAEDERFRHKASVVYYRVDDIHASSEALRGRGVRVEGEPHLIARMPDHDLWMAFFEDSEGNVFALMSEVSS